jgi:hypothetical protein
MSETCDVQDDVNSAYLFHLEKQVHELRLIYLNQIQTELHKTRLVYLKLCNNDDRLACQRQLVSEIIKLGHMINEMNNFTNRKTP